VGKKKKKIKYFECWVQSLGNHVRVDSVFWNVTSCHLIGVYQCFSGMARLFQVRNLLYSEDRISMFLWKSVSIYQSTLHHIPEDVIFIFQPCSILAESIQLFFSHVLYWQSLFSCVIDTITGSKCFISFLDKTIQPTI
jgi:hypothetical protein